MVLTIVVVVVVVVAAAAAVIVVADLIFPEGLMKLVKNTIRWNGYHRLLIL